MNPEDFPNLYRWWRADSYTTAVDGDSVGGGVNTHGPWVDKTGSGDDGARGVSGPIFKANIFGVRPVIRFATEFLNVATGPLTDMTIVSVHQQKGTTSMLMQDSFGTGDQMRLSFLGDNVKLFYDGTGAGQGANAFAAPTAPLCLVCRRSGTTVSFRENQTARGSFVYSNANWSVAEIGSASLGGSVDIAEILIWSRALTDVELDDLYTGYLQPRYPAILP